MTRFSFIHITDHHLGEAETSLLHGFSPAYALRTVMAHIARHAAAKADFIVSTGDLVDPPSEAAYAAVRALLKIKSDSAPAPGPLSVSIAGLHDYPMYFLPGNHDDRASFYRALFPRIPVSQLVNATFIHQGLQFVCLDWGPEAKAVADRTMLDYLAGALQDNRPTILLMHHQPVSVGSRWLDDFIADNVAEFWETVRGRPVLGIFCGHAHLTYESVVEGIPVFGLRSTVYQFAKQDRPLLSLEPPHYRLVTVADGAISTQVFEVPL